MPIRLIDSDYWRARDIRKLKPRTRAIYNFLMGCPAGDVSGLFQFDPDEFILQTGWTEKEWEASMAELKKAGKIKTEGEDLMWIVNAWQREPNHGIKNLIHCCKQLNKFLKHGLAKEYLEKYSHYFEMDGHEVAIVDGPVQEKKAGTKSGVEVDLGVTKTARRRKGKYIDDADMEAWIETTLWKPYPVPKSGRGSKLKVFKRVQKILEKELDTRQGLAKAVQEYKRKREGEDSRYTIMAEGFFNPEHERWLELGAATPDEQGDEREKAARQHEATKLQEELASGLCKPMPGSKGGA